MTITSTAEDESTNNRRRGAVVDYDEEGRQLLMRVGLLDEHGNPTTTDASQRVSRHAYSNMIYKEPQTGGTLHVGNHMAAESMDLLNQMTPGPCRRIVYCLDSYDGKVFLENEEFEYLDFNIGWWWSSLGKERDNPLKVVEYFEPLFAFVDHALRQGRSILIHCLAGAHRAGTAGIASLMHLTGMSAEEATRTAKQLRPIINPIGDFPSCCNCSKLGCK